MRKIVVVVMLCCPIVGCGGGSIATKSQPTVAVSPASVTLYASQTQQFQASVSGATSQSVTWSAASGSITSSGLYTAPKSGSVDIVTATSSADATYKGTASISVNPAPVVSIALQSGNPVLPPGTTDQFEASINGTVSTDVRWSTSAGTITQNGLFLAPSVPDGTTVIVTATSSADSAATATYTLNITTQPVFASAYVSPTSASANNLDTFTVYWKTYNAMEVTVYSPINTNQGYDDPPAGSMSFGAIFAAGQYSIKLDAEGTTCNPGTLGSTCVHPTVTTYVPFTVTK